MSIRLDAKTTQLVERLARRSRRTKSDLVRAAITSYAEAEEAGSGNLLDAIRHLVGSVDTGGANLSERTGDRFAKLLREKQRARRSR